MSHPSSPTSEALLERFQALLDTYGVAAERSGDALVFPGETASGVCDGLLHIEALETGEAVGGATVQLALCTVVFDLPLHPVDRRRRAATYELLGLIGPDVAVGRFELSGDDDLVRFRAEQLVPLGVPYPDGALIAPCLEALNVIDAWYESVQRVVEQSFDPAHVYADRLITEVQASGVPLGEATRARLVSLVETATARYADGEPSAGGDALLDLLRRVTAS